jgi:hypothetical protein
MNKVRSVYLEGFQSNHGEEKKNLISEKGISPTMINVLGRVKSQNRHSPGPV